MNNSVRCTYIISYYRNRPLFNKYAIIPKVLSMVYGSFVHKEKNSCNKSTLGLNALLPAMKEKGKQIIFANTYKVFHNTNVCVKVREGKQLKKN